MEWSTGYPAWILGGLAIFFILFVIAMLTRNSGAKTDKNNGAQRNTKESDIGIKRKDR